MFNSSLILQQRKNSNIKTNILVYILKFENISSETDISNAENRLQVPQFIISHDKARQVHITTAPVQY